MRNLELEEYCRSIQPDQKYVDWKQQVSGVWIPVELEGPSAQDLKRFGFGAEDPVDSPSREQSFVGNIGRSRLLRAAGALGLAFLGGAAIIENTHFSEAATINPLPNGDLGIDNFPDPAQLIQDASTTLQNPEVVTGDFETIVGRDNKRAKRISGERDDFSKLNSIIVPVGFSTFEQVMPDAQEMVRAIYEVKPMMDYQGKIVFWLLDPVGAPNTGCVTEPGIHCSGDLGQVIDQINSDFKVTFQETIFFINSDKVVDSGQQDIDNPPSFHSYLITTNALLKSQELRSGYAHGLGHAWLNEVDEYSYPGKNENIGNTYWNCRRNVDIWIGKPGNPGTQYKGCSEDPNAYRTGDNNVMGSYNPDFGPLNSWWIDQIMQDPVYRYRFPQPAITIKLSGLNISADLVAPLGTTQKRRLITPYNSDGPGITLIRNQETSYTIPAPQIGVGNYILLPDMTYTWEERDTNAKVSIPWESPQWNQYSPWPLQTKDKAPAVGVFRTPKRFSDGISAISPRMGEVVGTSNPILVWGNLDKDVYYYEVQVSKDCSFNTDPQTAIAAVQWNLIHGGETTPLNSYRAAPLEPGIKYCWRVKPRVQGDGTPVSWSPNFEFQTPATLKSAGG